MTHAKKPKRTRLSYPNGEGLDRAAGWQAPGVVTADLQLKRRKFLREAVDASPTLLSKYKALRRHALDVKFELAPTWSRSDPLNWDEIKAEVERIENTPSTSALSDSARGVLVEFAEALRNWRDEHHLTPTTKDSVDDWVCGQAAFNLLYATGTPFLPAGVDWPPGVDVPLPSWGEKLEIRLDPWDALGSAAAWHVSTLREVDRQLREHISQAEQAMTTAGYRRIPETYDPGWENLLRAARWQVLGEDWGEFLEREGFTVDDRDGDSATTALKRALTNALVHIGIAPRAGMRT